MTAIDIELLVATAAAIWIGTGLPTRRGLFSFTLGFSVIAWVIRCALIVDGPGADVSVAESYLNGLTIWNAAAEVGLFALWEILWALVGIMAVKCLRRKAKATNQAP